ncbi:MAG TPA: N-acetylglucosamine-6-phosphate deacetylase [Armatimonadetes bacterium]|nr:N-acetylglucosamine-6-phosphate deacetylase [Armatimonadota bacterium]
MSDKEANDALLNAEQCYVVPGLIDIHVNGGGGGSFDLATEEDISKALAFHACGGTTALLATLNTAPHDQRVYALNAIKRWMLNQTERAFPQVLGIYLEGPYYNTEQRGAHPLELLHPPKRDEYTSLLNQFGDIIRVFSLAPELPGALEFVSELKRYNIIAACGHSNANYHQLIAAMDAGLNLITHLYCAHSSFHRINAEKQLGVAETALLRDELTVEVIPDGKHTTVEMMQFILKCKPLNRICIITDCMPAAGVCIGEYEFLGQRMFITEEVAYRPDRKMYAGSVITMNKALQFLTNSVGIPLEHAIEMATWVPARLLGIAPHKGCIRVGSDADVTVLSEDLDVIATFCRGKLAYIREPERVAK